MPRQLVLRLSGERLGASKRAAHRGRWPRTLVGPARPDRVLANLLAAMRQAGIRRVTATAITRIVTAEGTRTMRVKVRLRR